MEQLQNKLFELKSLLLNSEEYKEVKNNEKILLENDILLISDFNKKEEEYNDSIKYGYYEDKYLINLKEAKEKLYSSNDYKNYNESINKMNNLLHSISELIFNDIVPDLKIK